jgi:hypothetical protein
MKISFGIIVFNGEEFLKECIDSIYPYAHEILIAEGPVQHYRLRGYNTSTDKTNDIINNYPDIDNKIKVNRGQYIEKTHQCNEYIKMIDITTDYVWHVDSDEIYKSEDIEKVIELLEKEEYTKVGFKTYTFFGGFDRYMGGFVENFEFVRIYKYKYGAYWGEHRPPKIIYPNDRREMCHKYLTGNHLLEQYDIRIYHYSMVYISQVYEKMIYYKKNISKHLSIPNYFNNVYIPWLLSNEEKRKEIEKKYKGVHEFKPKIRGESYTKIFKKRHPLIIEENMDRFIMKYNKQIEDYVVTNNLD